MTVKPEDIDGKMLAVILISENDKGEDEFAWFGGKATFNNGALRVDRGTAGPSFTVPDSAYDRIQKCTEEMKTNFEGCEYLVSLLVGPLPEDADPGDFEPIGLKWPE
jgi:hypothetical protein